jgi:hypothetical protein
MWSGTRLSWLCGGVFSGQADDIDFFGVGWPGRDALDLAAMRTPRSLPVMSAVDGWTLVVYQGAGPVMYHVGGVVTGGDVPANDGGLAGELERTVRSTALAKRLRACPAPKTC